MNQLVYVKAQFSYLGPIPQCGETINIIAHRLQSIGARKIEVFHKTPNITVHCWIPQKNIEQMYFIDKIIQVEEL